MSQPAQPSVETAPNSPPPGARHVVLDAITNYSATIFSACLGLIMVPILLDALGTAAYGLLITSFMVGSMFPFDLGLGWSLTHEIAKGSPARAEVENPFVSSAGWLFLSLGFLGVIFVVAFGFVFAGLHPGGPTSTHQTELIFLLAGMGFLGEHMQVYILSVLHGLRRFGSANLILMASAFVRAVGAYLLLRAGAQVISIAAWQAFVSLMIGFCGTLLVTRLTPIALWRFAWPGWNELRGHFGLAFSGQATMTATSWLWQSTPLLVGLMRGASSVVPFYIGQRFPMGVSLLNWKAAEPMFPAASAELGHAEGRKRVLLAGTRWITAVSLPLCVFFWIEAPALLHAWIGNYPEGAVLILRLTTVAVFADSLGVGAMHVLLAAGAAKNVLLTTLSATSATVVLSLVFSYYFRPEFAVWALVVPMLAGTAAMLWFSKHASGIGLMIFARLLARLFFPIAVFTTAVCLLNLVIPKYHLIQLFVIGAAAATAYAIALFYTGLSASERERVTQLLASRISVRLQFSRPD